MGNAVTQNRWRSEHAKFWIFHKIAKLRNGGDMLQLPRTRAVIFQRWHVADVKNNTSDDQATLVVDQNSADIAYTFWFYVCLHLWDRDWCSAAYGSGSCHGLEPSFLEEICQRQKHRRRQPGSIEIPQLSKFMPTRSSKISQKHLFAARTPTLWCHCTLIFFYSRFQ